MDEVVRPSQKSWLNSDDVKVDFFRMGFCLDVHSETVHICTETSSIAWEILRAQSDSSTSLQFDRRPMALPYGRERRLEANQIHFSGRSFHHQLTNIGLMMENDLLEVGCNLDKFWSPRARSTQRLRSIRFHIQQLP
jgi:hypothetical protein